MPDAPRDAGLKPLGRVWGAAVAIGAIAILAASVVERLFSATPPVWDDAYMFFRYAENLIHDGRPAWNPGGASTWGATSLLYVVVVAVARVLGPADPLQVLLAASLVCGALLLVLIARLAGATGSGAIAFAFAAMAFQSRPLSAHFVSGMDTAFGAAWLAAYLLLACRQRDRGTMGGAAVQAIAGGLALFARPELLVFTLAVPAAMAVFAREPAVRRHAWIAVAGTAAVVVLGLGVAAMVFGAPLPLPFYVKALGVYGEAMRAAYEGVGLRESLTFAVYNAPLAIAAVAGAIAWHRSAGRPDLSLETGLFAALMVFTAFQSFAVTPIMFYDQRFLYAALPAVVFVGCRGLALARQPSRAVLAAATLLLVVPAVTVTTGLVTNLRTQNGRVAPLTLEASRRAHADDWFALDRLRELPDDLVIATTEVVHQGALLPGKTIVDLAGLNDTRLARKGLAPAELFRRRPPDWIYLPHGDYREFAEAIQADPYFVAHYDAFPRETLGTARVETAGRVESKPYWLSVAILRDGPYAARLRSIIEEERRR